jgi:DNA-binding transcriptional LysR family regulator
MDQFRELQTFVAVAEAGAFNAAARRLAMSPPAVTRAVTALEARLGVQLFTRTTRQVALTEAGARLVDDARRILADLAEAEASAAGAHDAPRGTLHLTAPVLFGERFVAPVLRDWLDAHPGVTANALFVDRIVDLIGEGLDVALRIGDLPDSGLIATRVGAVRRVVVAAPDYLARAGSPAAPDDLADHRIVEATGLGTAPDWSFAAAGARCRVRVDPTLRVSTVAAAIDAALAGWGLARVLSYQVADALAAGTLVEVLAGSDAARMPIHLVHAEGRRPAAKIRSFVDFAAARLRPEADRLAAL